MFVVVFLCFRKETEHDKLKHIISNNCIICNKQEISRIYKVTGKEETGVK